MVEETWFSNKTWDPTLLTDSRKQPATDAVEVEVVPEAEVKQRASTVYEPDIQADYYGWLYQDVGGEG